MIPITLKKDMINLLGQTARREGITVSWDRLSFEEKMILAESILDFAVSKIKCGFDFEKMGQELRMSQ